MIPLVLNPSGEMQTRPLMEVITLARKRNGYGKYTLEERREAKRRNSRVYEAKVRLTPEYKARKAQRDKRRRARIMADPDLRKAHNARSAELKRIRRQRMKEERPDEYRAWREREKARLRARYERMKAGKAAP